MRKGTRLSPSLTVCDRHAGGEPGNEAIRTEYTGDQVTENSSDKIFSTWNRLRRYPREKIKARRQRKTSEWSPRQKLERGVTIHCNELHLGRGYV